ncbi:hypothetical protein [Aliivibrio fischeri]|uniref:Uncharacterized protein n=1 Tax=Aliivibrio fischeri TaxID=668 RepID=A0A510UNE4_ALIFS|nr:hypothetical protein [Aliivibrio fischeri]MUK51228.1 hypothetical protein [Aliivibrio fischeri]GEK16144.1 hypothetical protein AFI02nite_41800 [Aliivibrio fischeri]
MFGWVKDKLKLIVTSVILIFLSWLFFKLFKEHSFYIMAVIAFNYFVYTKYIK